MPLTLSQLAFTLLGGHELRARTDSELELILDDSEDIMVKTMRRRLARKSNPLNETTAPAKNFILFLADPKNVGNTIFLVERVSMLTNGEQTENVNIPTKNMTQTISAASEDAIVSKVTSGALDVKQAGPTMILLLKQKVKGRLKIGLLALSIFQCLTIKNYNMLL